MSQMMRAQQEQVMKSQYGPLARQLKLTPEQTDQFFSILSNQQNANMTNGLNMLSGGDQATDAAKANKSIEADTENQLQALLGTAPLPVSDLLLLLTYPVIVWGADELMRFVLRKRARHED